MVVGRRQRYDRNGVNRPPGYDFGPCRPRNRKIPQPALWSQPKNVVTIKKSPTLVASATNESDPALVCSPPPDRIASSVLTP